MSPLDSHCRKRQLNSGNLVDLHHLPLNCSSELFIVPFSSDLDQWAIAPDKETTAAGKILNIDQLQCHCREPGNTVNEPGCQSKYNVNGIKGSCYTD